MEHILVFPNVDSAVKAENVLLGGGFSVSVMPLPKSVASGCGIALRFSGEQKRDVLGALAKSGVSVKSVWLREKTASGYEYKVVS